MPELLRLTNFQVRFSTPEGDVAAVRGVDLSLAPGETLALVGESGAGKSQLLLGLLGLLPPTGRVYGSARFQGRELAGLPEAECARLRGAAIGMVFQDPFTSLNPYLRVGRQLTEGVRWHHDLSPAQARDKVLGLLEALHFAAPARLLRRYPHELSGGQRQRIGLAMALACDPALLLADEPTTALDVTVQAELLALLRAEQARRGMALLLVSHDMDVAATVCDRLAVLYAGQVVETGPLAAVRATPRHPYTRALLAAVPRLDGAGGVAIGGEPPDPRLLPAGCTFHPRCPLATERCRTEPPALRPLGDGVQAACHYAEPA